MNTKYTVEYFVADPKVVALVYDGDDGTLIDGTWNWETAQNYALSEGARIVAIRDDGPNYPREWIQRYCDSERASFRDCFGYPPTVSLVKEA